MANTQLFHSVSGSRTDNVCILTGSWVVPEILSGGTIITPAEFDRQSGAGFTPQATSGTVSYAGVGSCFQWAFTIEEAWQALIFADMMIIQDNTTSIGKVPAFTNIEPDVDPTDDFSTKGSTLELITGQPSAALAWTPQPGLSVNVVLGFLNF